MIAQGTVTSTDPGAGRVTVSKMLTAAAELAQRPQEPSECTSATETRKKRIPKRTVSEAIPKEVGMEKATKIECHLTKYAVAIRMQNMECFSVNLEERKLHFDRLSIACTRKEATVEKLKPVHVYNAASPEMPEPKEKRFEAEYSEAPQQDNSNSIR